ncbi:formate hydrogenlyase subunit 3 [Raoultella terrigena]|uniref:Formate hydrogenlyase subunit 3 n=1 Tax=Raoultella terrigena TaxID=577 RepID=A0A4U9D0R0_RAOTE|nr:formate hydrogenlyase subunit 3 [Raoultella terrigena]
MVVTAHGFAMPVKEAFAPLLKLRHWLNPVRLIPGWHSGSAPALLRGVALIELAVLVVICHFTRSLRMSVFVALLQALVLFARRAAAVRHHPRCPRPSA